MRALMSISLLPSPSTSALHASSCLQPTILSPFRSPATATGTTTLITSATTTARRCSPIRHHSHLSSSPETLDAAAADVEGGGDKRFDWFAQWYPVAPVCDLDKRRPHAKTVMGLDIVVWWDRSANRWQVFDDRCPHRLAPLSEGRVDPWGRLQCVYHGWCFDGAGNCKYIPQAPDDGPPVHTFSKACASVYPSYEQNKILWFWASTDLQYRNILMKERPPYISELDDPSYTSTMGIRDLPYGYEVLLENLMDPAHVPYAHHGIMGIPKRGPSRDREGGRPIDIKIETSGIMGFFAKQDTGYTKFIAPCVFYAVPRGSPVNESPINPQKNQRRFLLVFMCVPVSPGKSRVIYVFPRNFATWLDKLIPRWILHVGQNLILDSDLYLLHVEERKIAKVGHSNWLKSCFVPTKSDAMVVAFRNWLKKYSDNQVQWGPTINGQLPDTPPREQLMDRYRSHVLQCRSCDNALKGLQVFETSLQIISIVSLGVVAAFKQNIVSTVARSAMISLAIICFVGSRWLSHFIHKNFYYHDYDHAFR